MATAERESTEEWVLPDDARPPLLTELEARIEEAMATAKATESAVVTIGAAAIDAAEQARYAAELAERASAAMMNASMNGTAPVPSAAAPAPNPAGEGEAAAGEIPDADAAESDGDDLAAFHARADRLAARLEKLQQSPALAGE